MGQRLYVGNLPYTASESELEAFFAPVGNVREVRMMRDMATGQSRGFAFVEMESDADAQSAIEQLHDQELGGRRLQINEARPQVSRAGSGGSHGPRQRREPRW